MIAASLAPADGCVERLPRRRGRPGDLAGLRLAVKDNIEVAGAIYSAGHPLFADRLGRHTAPAVSTLIQAGAEPVAMAATDAGGFGVTTPGVRNPRHPHRVVGGSSGGCAALIAAGEADLGLGTDTGGSVRIPAACTGIWGLKPRHGAVPAEGVWPLAPSFDVVGLMAADVSVLKRAARVLLPDMALRPTRPLRSLTYIETSDAWPRDRATARLFADRLATARRTGIKLNPLRLPPRDAVIRCHATIVLLEASAVYAGFDDAARAQLAPSAVKALRAAERLSGGDRASAAATMDEVKERLNALEGNIDALISPTLSILPPRVDVASDKGAAYAILSGMTAETCIANLTGRPAIAGPSGCLSLQLTGLAAGTFDIVQAAPALFENLATPV